jgi:hypothetical protein
VDDPVIEINVFIIAVSLEIVSFSLFADDVKRYVEFGAFSLSHSAVGEVSAWSAGIVGAPVISMHRDEEDVAVVVKDVVSAVALVNIVVNDGDASQIVFYLQITSSHCHIVEHTKPINAALLARVMAWRSHHAEAIGPLSAHDAVDSFQYSSSRYSGCHLRVRVAVRVGNRDTETVLALRPQLSQVINVFLGVYEANVIVAGHAIVL